MRPAPALAGLCCHQIPAIRAVVSNWRSPAGHRPTSSVMGVVRSLRPAMQASSSPRGRTAMPTQGRGYPHPCLPLAGACLLSPPESWHQRREIQGQQQAPPSPHRQKGQGARQEKCIYVARTDPPQGGASASALVDTSISTADHFSGISCRHCQQVAGAMFSDKH